MGKINIFWIEDNPLFGTARGDSRRLDNFMASLPDKELFSFTLFQHPYEVREFLDMKNRLKEEYSRFSKKCPTNIPDIVVFDYKLSESFIPRNPNALEYENEDAKKLLVGMSASNAFKLSFPEYFNNKSLFIDFNLGERIEANVDIAMSIGVESGSLSNIDDEFGLFCGLSVIREFKDSITCGAPATINKPEVNNLNVNSAFFEWVNKYDLKNALEKEGRNSKDFNNNIIPISVSLLRSRILEQLTTNKVTIDLNNIISLIDSFTDTDKLEGIGKSYFSFDSVYGKRSLPLDGLFFDKKETTIIDIPKELVDLSNRKAITERDVAIWNFLNDVLTALIDASKLGVGISDIENAITNSHNLLRVFDSVDFKKRIFLSYYHAKVIKNGVGDLTKDEKSIYYECLKLFVIEGDKIERPGEYSLSIIGSKGKGANKMINRLTVFFVATLLWERYCSYISSLDDETTNSHTPQDQSHIAIIPPKTMDLLLALFPIWTGHIILFNENGALLKAPLEAMGKSKLGTLCDFVYSDIDDGNGVDMRKQMTKGEYMIVKSFATSLGFKITPFWLKKYSDE